MEIKTASLLVQFAVSRTREFEADLNAAALLGDPSGLASALTKLDSFHRGLTRLLPLDMAEAIPPALRSHPATRERAARLLELLPARPSEPPGLVSPRRWVTVPQPGRLHHLGAWAVPLPTGGWVVHVRA